MTESGTPTVAVTCRYAPVELLAGFGARCRVLDAPVPDTARADETAHANLCGFGKAVIQQAREGGIRAGGQLGRPEALGREHGGVARGRILQDERDHLAAPGLERLDSLARI